MIINQAFAQCSTEDTIVLAKQGYKKHEIEKMCVTDKSRKTKSKSAENHAEYIRIVGSLVQLFDAQFHLEGSGKYSRSVMDKKTSVRINKKKIYFETQIQNTSHGEGGTSASGSNNISSSALLADLDPETIVIRGETVFGDNFIYDITIRCKADSRCATRTDINGSNSATEVIGNYMRLLQNQI